MLSNRSRILVAAILGVMLAIAGEAKANFITRSSAGGLTLAPAGGPPGSETWANSNSGPKGSAAAGKLRGSVATSSVSLIGLNSGIHLFAEAGPIPGEEFAVASAQWIDVIRTAGVGTPPDKLRVVLELAGIMNVGRAASPGIQNTAEARVGIAQFQGDELLDFGGSIPLIVNRFNTSPQTEAIVRLQGSLQGPPYQSYFQLDDRITTLLDSQRYLDSVQWSKTFDLSYNPTIGGYRLNLYAAARALGSFGGAATTNFGSTIRLTNVTRTDGSALPGGVTFDSGYTIQAVPEPSSVVMLGCGTFGLLLVYGRRRRRAADA